MPRKINRRTLIGLGLAAVAGGAFYIRRLIHPDRAITGPAAPVSPHNMQYIGASFSINHAKWRNGVWGGPVHGPAWQESLQQILELGFNRLRLSVQMNQVVGGDQPDFSEIEEALELCKEFKVPVLLCVGAKAPRWPEVHLPDELKARASRRDPGIGSTELNTTDQGIRQPVLDYVELMLKRYGKDRRIEAIQIENEPLEAFGDPALSVPLDFLKQEVKLARRFTEKPLALTFGAGLTDPILSNAKSERQQILEQLLSLRSDWVGLDLYQKGYRHIGPIEVGFEATAEHWAMASDFVKQIKAAGKTAFLGEVQGEPWEADPAKFNFRNADGNMSLTPASYAQILDRTGQTGVDRVYLWGLEFQVACAHQGNQAWLDVTRDFLEKRRSH